MIDLSEGDATIGYSRWFFSGSGNPDALTVWVTNDGLDWSLVESVPAAGNNAWKTHSFKVGDFVEPGPTIQVRFRADDTPSDSITEAGIDLFEVQRFVCSPSAEGSGRVFNVALRKQAAAEIVLSWGGSCHAGDSDFAIYEGALGQFTTHAPVSCMTGGTTMSAPFTPATGDRYYLVVPSNGTSEGSYGTDSAGAARPASAGACLAQQISACP